MSTVSIFLGLFNICAGLMVVAALLFFLGGFLNYLILLGTERRKEGLVLMVWGVVILFVLVVLLGIIDILQGPFFFLLAIGLVIFLAIVAVLSIKPGSSEKPAADHQ